MAKLIYLLSFIVFVNVNGSRVLELSDKFSEVYKEGGFWLVKFYAPWCGHCKRLEPVWAQVAQALFKTNVRVGRVDCTRFTSLCNEFSIAGFPSIKFIKLDEHHTYQGDRTKEDLVNFAMRMAGPPVQEITKPESLNNIKNANDLFFMYVGEQEGPLWEAYYHVAEKLQPHGFFYTVNPEIARQHTDIEELPAVFVYKENLHFFYQCKFALEPARYVHYFFENEILVESGSGELEAEHLNNSMYHWINQERFNTFHKITKGNINEIMHTKKYIVIVVLEENKLKQIPPEQLAFKNMVNSVIINKRDKYHKYFQFGWVGDSHLGNSIAMQYLSLPNLIVLNSTSQHHHIPEDDPLQLTPDAIDVFLEGVLNQTVPAYGGDGYAVRIYRTYFEAKTMLTSMWKGNPVLTTVLFGLPFGFLCLILYSICCADILDAEEEEEEELLHEKRE